jgi:hypothetical protein
MVFLKEAPMRATFEMGEETPPEPAGGRRVGQLVLEPGTGLPFRATTKSPCAN